MARTDIPVKTLPDDGKLVYTIAEAARFLGIGRNQCYDAATAGTIPAYRVGRRWIVPRAAFARFLEGTWQPEVRVTHLDPTPIRRRAS